MRNRIILATVEEINLRGFKFTMNDLTKRLSISKSSLYEHFASKDKLIATILDMVLHDFQVQEEKIYNADLAIIEKLKALLTIMPQNFEPFHNRVYDDLRRSYPGEWEKIVAFRKKRMDHLTTLLITGMDKGIIRHVNINVVQQIIISTTNDLIGYPFLSANNMTYTDAVVEMLDVIIHGLAVTK